MTDLQKLQAALTEIGVEHTILHTHSRQYLEIRHNRQHDRPFPQPPEKRTITNIEFDQFGNYDKAVWHQFPYRRIND